MSQQVVNVEGVNIPVTTPPQAQPEPKPKTKDPLYWTKDFPLRFVKIFAGPPEQPRFDKSGSFRIYGCREGGKSSTAEAIALKFRERGGNIYDLCAAADNEQLGFLDAPFVEDVVLLKGDECLIEPPQGAKYRIMRASDLDPLTVPEDKKVYVLCRKLFYSEELYYQQMLRIVERCALKDSWNHIGCILIRESEQFLSATLRTHQAKTSAEAAAQVGRLNATLMHTGHSIVMDSVRDVEVLKTLREVSTYVVMKRMGNMQIQRQYFWIFRFITPETLRHLFPHQSIVLTESGTLALMYNLLPPFHIVRGSSLAKKHGLDNPKFDMEAVKRIQREQRQSQSGWQRVVSFEDHQKIVEYRKQNPPITFERIANQLGISESSCRRSMNLHLRNPRLCECEPDAT